MFRPDTSQRQQRQIAAIPPCQAFVPLKCSSTNVQFPHRVCPLPRRKCHGNLPLLKNKANNTACKVFMYFLSCLLSVYRKIPKAVWYWTKSTRGWIYSRRITLDFATRIHKIKRLVSKSPASTGPNFMALLTGKQRGGACGSMELCAHVKLISLVRPNKNKNTSSASPPASFFLLFTIFWFL